MHARYYYDGWAVWNMKRCFTKLLERAEKNAKNGMNLADVVHVACRYVVRSVTRPRTTVLIQC
jgi:hypothetical protein